MTTIEIKPPAVTIRAGDPARAKEGYEQRYLDRVRQLLTDETLANVYVIVPVEMKELASWLSEQLSEEGYQCSIEQHTFEWTLWVARPTEPTLH